MKKFYTIVWLVIFTPVAMAQCLINGITTNPENPVNNQIPAKRNTFFDWRQSIFTVNDPRIGSGIYSPFYQSDNPLINHFLYNRDYSPSDGWELLKYDFGLNEDGTPKPQTSSTVYLVLYNKYTSMLRVFYAADQNGGYNGASISLSLTGNTVPSLFNDADQFNAVDNFKQANPKSLSQFLNNVGRWMYADFYMMYDPCTCNNLTNLNLQLDLINKSHIDLKGKITGTITSIDNNQGTVNEDKYSLSNLDPSNPKKAYNYVKDMSELANKAAGIVKNANPRITDAISNFAANIKLPSFLKSGLKAVSYVGAAMELFDLFSGGGKDAGPQEVKIMPMAITADIGLSGTLEANYHFGSTTMSTPGSVKTSNYVASEYPYYNEVLGVFNLLSSPTYSGFATGSRVKLDNGWDYTGVTNGYKINNQLRYAVNPASGLDVQEILAQVILKLARVNKLDSTISTSALVPVTSIANYTLASSTGGINIQPNPNFDLVNSRVFVKLFINLKRRNASATSQNVLHVLTYPVLATSPSSFNGWVDQIDNSYKNPEFTSLLGFPQNLVIGTSQDITTSKGATSNVTIAPADVAQSRYVRDADGRYYWETYYVPGPPISVTSSNNSQVLAGNSISIASGATITAGLALRTISGERNDILFPQSSGAISSFCNSSSYQILSRNLRIAKDEQEKPDTETEKRQSLSSFPNPTTGKVSFRYYLDEPSQVQLNLISVTGTIVATPVEETYQEAGSYEFTYDATNLPAGVYIYTLETNKGKETKRLIVIK